MSLTINDEEELKEALEALKEFLEEENPSTKELHLAKDFFKKAINLIDEELDERL